MIRIAVCEDDYVYTEIIRSILQSCVTVPYEVKFFSSGTEFLNTLTDHGCPYTLVITDTISELNPSTELPLPKESIR